MDSDRAVTLERVLAMAQPARDAIMDALSAQSPFAPARLALRATCRAMRAMFAPPPHGALTSLAVIHAAARTCDTVILARVLSVGVRGLTSSSRDADRADAFGWMVTHMCEVVGAIPRTRDIDAVLRDIDCAGRGVLSQYECAQSATIIALLLDNRMDAAQRRYDALPSQRPRMAAARGALHCAATCGNVRACTIAHDWLAAEWPWAIGYDDMMRCAARGARLNIVQLMYSWMCAMTPPVTDKVMESALTYALVSGAAVGSREICTFAHARGAYATDHMLVNAAIRGDCALISLAHTWLHGEDAARLADRITSKKQVCAYALRAAVGAAARHGHVRAVALLVRLGADDFGRVMYEGMMRGSARLVRIAARDRATLRAAAHIAARCGTIRAVALATDVCHCDPGALLRAIARELDCRGNIDGDSVATESECTTRILGVIEWLRVRGATDPHDMDVLLIEAAAQDNERVIDYALAHGAVTIDDAACAAARAGCGDTVQYLISRGARDIAAIVTHASLRDNKPRESRRFAERICDTIMQTSPLFDIAHATVQHIRIRDGALEDVYESMDWRDTARIFTIASVGIARHSARTREAARKYGAHVSAITRDRAQP